MRPFKCFCAILLLIAYSIAPVLADATDVQTIPCEPDFVLWSVEVASDGSFLIAGMTGATSDTDTVPMLLNVDANGTILWSLKQEGLTGDNQYRDAKYLDEDTILALCSARDSHDDFADEWTVQFITQGTLTHQTEPKRGVTGIQCVSDGFFTYGTPTSGLARIEKLNAKGEPMWHIEWEERLRFTNIASQYDQYIAFGSKTVIENGMESRKKSVVLAFDDQGNILWRHDSDTYEGYTDAVYDNDHLVLVGHTIPPSRFENPDPDQDRAEHGFVTEIDQGRQVWRLDSIMTLPGEDFTVDSIMTSIVPVQEGYLMSQVAQHKVRLLLVDANGSLVKEWSEDIGGVANPLRTFLLQSNGRVFLVVNGDDRLIADAADGGSTPGRITIIKECKIPE